MFFSLFLLIFFDILFINFFLLIIFFFKGVNMIRSAASFETIQRYWTNYLTTPKIKEIMTSCDSNVLLKLATRLGESKVNIYKNMDRSIHLNRDRPIFLFSCLLFYYYYD